MKNKKFIKKVAQYIELSREFGKSETELFGEVNEPTLIDCGTSISVGTTLTTNAPIFGYWHTTAEYTPKTRAEKILEKADLERRMAEQEAARANRYDKYLKLREELSFFVNAYLKL